MIHMSASLKIIDRLRRLTLISSDVPDVATLTALIEASLGTYLDITVLSELFDEAVRTLDGIQARDNLKRKGQIIISSLLSNFHAVGIEFKPPELSDDHGCSFNYLLEGAW